MPGYSCWALATSSFTFVGTISPRISAPGANGPVNFIPKQVPNPVESDSAVHTLFSGACSRTFFLDSISAPVQPPVVQEQTPTLLCQPPGCAKKDPNGAPWLLRLRNNRNERLTSLPVVAAPIETPHPLCASLCYARIRKTLRVSVRHIGASIDTFFSAFPVSQSDFCRRFCDFSFSPPGKAMDHRQCAGHDG